MGKDIQIFNNDKFGQLRTVIIDNEPWFVGKDVADTLGYSDTNKAVAMHVDDEDKKLNDKTSPSFGQRGATLINESGVYSLVFGSKLESAKEFKHWVTHDVLPSIRKTGAYQIPQLRGEAKAPKLDSETAEKLALQKQKAATAAANARARTSSLYLRAAKMTTNAVWRNVLIATSANVLSGKELIPAPSSKNGRIRHPLGWFAVHCLGHADTWASVLGKKLKKFGIKQSDGETGEFVENKAKGCNKQVQTFEWYEDYLVPTIRGLIEQGMLFRAGDVPMEDVLSQRDDKEER